MKRFLKLLMFCLSFSLAASDTYCATIKITCRSKGMELELCKEAINDWIKANGGKHKVEIVTLPHASNECFALYQQWLSAESFDVDILQMDVAWIGVFSEYLADLSQFFKADEIDMNDYFPAIQKNMYDTNGRLVALPWYTDCGIMYYRADLLDKYSKRLPRTLQELQETALYIQNEERKDEQKKNKFYGLVFQAKAFEILTCNFAEAIDAFGGAIVKDGKAVINSKQGVDATLFLINCFKTITSRSALNYSEEDARGMFQSGNAVFMRNWPYAWSLLNDSSTAVSGKVGVMPIPPSATGGKATGVLGGWFLTVSKYSKHAGLAADLVKFLTSKKEQKMRSKYSYLPAFKSLYKDDYVLRYNPFFVHLRDSLESAVARPSIAFAKNYSRASTEIFNTINTIITDSIESDVSRRNVEKQLNRLNRKLDAILKKASLTAKKKSGLGLWKKLKILAGLEEPEAPKEEEKKSVSILDKAKSFLGLQTDAVEDN